MADQQSQRSRFGASDDRAREQLSFAVSLGIANAPEQLMLHDEIEDQEV
jgi:hypothetical protein